MSWAALDDGDFNLHFNPHERNRFDSWRESLLQELVLNQGYFYDIDIIQIMDCQVGQLTHNHKSLIDRVPKLDGGRSHCFPSQKRSE